MSDSIQPVHVQIRKMLGAAALADARNPDRQRPAPSLPRVRFLERALPELDDREEERGE